MAHKVNQNPPPALFMRFPAHAFPIKRLSTTIAPSAGIAAPTPAKNLATTRVPSDQLGFEAFKDQIVKIKVMIAKKIVIRLNAGK